MPSKTDGAVERLVEKFYRPTFAPGDAAPAMRLPKPTLRAIITEARLSAARECADVLGSSIGARLIREHFGLEGK